MKLYSLGEQVTRGTNKEKLSLYDVEKLLELKHSFFLAMEMDQLKALPEEIQQEALESMLPS